MMVGWQINNCKGNLHTSFLCIDLCICPQILKAQEEALTQLSHVQNAGVFKIMSPFQGCVLGAASGTKKGKWNPLSKVHRAVRSLQSVQVQPSSPSVVVPC